MLLLYYHRNTWIGKDSWAPSHLHSFLLHPLLSLSSFFFTPGAIPVVAAVVCVLPQAQPSQSTELRPGRHRPGSSMGQNLLVFTGVGKAPLHQVTHQFAGVGAHSGVKSQALGRDSCARNLPKSFHTPCQPGNSCLRVHFSIASPRNLLLCHDDPRFHQPHDVPTVSVALAAHVSMNKGPWTLHNHPHQSRARRGKCIPSSSCGDKTVPTAQQGHPCQDTAQSHCLYQHIPSFSLIEDRQCRQQTP